MFKNRSFWNTEYKKSRSNLNYLIKKIELINGEIIEIKRSKNSKIQKLEEEVKKLKKENFLLRVNDYFNSKIISKNRYYLGSHNTSKSSPDGSNRVRIFVKSEDKDKIFIKYHKKPDGGHRSMLKTYKIIKKYFWWENMRKDIELKVKNCTLCYFKMSGID